MRVSHCTSSMIIAETIANFITTGEGHFDDGNKPSGTATPVEAGDAKAAKKRKSGSKKAKTTKQRLAIADEEMDM